MKIKLWHFIILILGVIILLNVGMLVNSIEMLWLFLVLLFSDFKHAIVQINISIIDYLISTFLIIIIPVFILIYNKQIKILQDKLTFIFAIMTLLLAVTIFAPLTASSNPNFQKDLRVTKLLTPFSTVQKLFLKKNEIKQENNLDYFILKKDEVIKKSFSQDFIFVNSVKTSGSDVIYIQKNKEIKIEKDKILFVEGKPLIESKTFILGTDQYGRDILSRLIYGTRLSLFIGLGAVIVSFFIGIILGFIAGYAGGFFDSLLNRFTEMFLAFPILFLIIFIIAMFDSSVFSIILVLGASGWMSLFKIVRAEVIKLKTKDFFITAKLIGLSNYKLLTKEVLPNIISPVVVNLVFLYGNVILAEAALSFLGLGAGNNYPSWGGMIQAGQSYITIAWWMIVFPGLMLFITLLTANELGRKIEHHFNSRIII